MKKKCPNCRLVNFPYSLECGRCSCDLVEVATVMEKPDERRSLAVSIIRRGAVLILVCLLVIGAFYVSLLATSKPLNSSQEETVSRAIGILEKAGFGDEVFLLETVTSYRSDDNWLNASTEKENAFAATNYPFEIMTLYPDFFERTKDDTERAAILLHEAKHLQGFGEMEAYKFVWENRQRLGWESDTYGKSAVWKSVRRQTREYVPTMFVCNFNEYRDCTEFADLPQ